MTYTQMFDTFNLTDLVQYCKEKNMKSTGKKTSCNQANSSVPGVRHIRGTDSPWKEKEEISKG